MRKNPSLIIAAGKGCFTCCKGCYQYFGKKQVLTDYLLDFIKEYKEEFELKKITLAGGDPMTRKDIVYLIEQLQKMDLEIYMDTVGKNFIKKSDIIFQDTGIAEYIDPLTLKGKISKIGIPLDGCTTEQINSFRKKITLDEILDILKVLNENNYDICINTVVNKNNIYDLKNIFKIIKNFENITQWQLFQYSPIGELGFKNRDLYEIDNKLFEDKIVELLELENETNIQIEGKSNSYRKLNYILVNSDGEVWQPKYNAYKSTFEIDDANSDKHIIGNIYDDNIIKKIRIYLDNINKNIEIINNQTSKILNKQEIINTNKIDDSEVYI